ncbi:DUF2235 domain-containing protein [Aliikangiella marina]|uniref:DUF2235 domain-containing protein n=1 Tax=Aliikangiella marina TaxID=1712262 RepID=A0A545TH54_9GAMM|nr:DUF2235 domain-containing protein [Aliikangiella marina]TQV76563.1 DUF2235 domain-containing protein [Aliikangiella marina]
MESRNKRLIICCDGTWNTPEKITNVIKTVRAIKPIADDGTPQVVFYDQGVGTYNLFDKFIGGAFGKGVEQNVLDAYRFIAHNYQAGDEIFCFGFSRGAYTARALGGMFQTIGLLPKNRLDELRVAYKYYRTPPHKRDAQVYSEFVRPSIQMMGVWDTVGALGAPTPFLGKLTKPLVGFFNTHLSPDIKNAFQALAIDEKRAPFVPALWTGKTLPEQTVEQVWFSGVHSDVGGGYKNSGLADIALMWMLHKANCLGLDFDQAYLSNPDNVNANVHDELHDSYNLFYRVMEKVTGMIGVRNLKGDPSEEPINVAIHDSVIERLTNIEDYRPENFDETLPISRTDDRRHFARFSTRHLTGSVQTENQVASCRILDYSPLGGVRVECEEDLELADSIVISSSKFAKTVANCAWKRGNTYGLRFAV